MKNYIFAVFAALLFAFSSCSNDEIEVTSVGKMTISINNRSLYSELEIESSIQSLILGKYESKHIGVTTLIYDAEGNLVKTFFNKHRTFQEFSMEVEGLKQGDYTVLAIETIVDDNFEGESFAWELYAPEKLNTLRCNTRKPTIYWYEALGVASQKISVADGNVRVVLQPFPMGCILNLGYEKFNGSGLVSFAVYMKNLADGVYLDPSLSLKDRLYFEDYNAQGTWGGRARLSNYPDELVDEDGIDVFMPELESQEICMGHSKASQVTESSWKISIIDGTRRTFNFEAGKQYQAYAIYNKQQESFNCFFGDKADFDAWYELNNPNSNIVYRVPCTEWGASVNTVKAYMKDYEAGNDGNLVASDASYVLWYHGFNKESEIDYYFKTLTGDLEQACVFADSKEVGEDELAATITAQGYEYLGSQDGATIYLSSDEKTVVCYMLNNENDWYIGYMKAELSTEKKDMRAIARKMQPTARRAPAVGASRSTTQMEQVAKFSFKQTLDNVNKSIRKMNGSSK